MKALILAFLLASGVANAASYCSGSINQDTQINSTSAGSTYTGSGCSVAPKCILTLCGCQLPSVGLPATSTYESGVVGAGGAIVVQGPSFEIAANCIPFIVTVKKNIFEQDACLRFCGSLPPSSVVTLSDNELNCTKPNPAFGYDDRIVTILLGDSDPMHLCAKSQLSIIRNIVCAINPCALIALAAFAIACFTQILLQLAACCRCCENNCTACVPPPCSTTTTTIETTAPVVTEETSTVTEATAATTTETTTPTSTTTPTTTTTTPTTTTTTPTTTTTTPTTTTTTPTTTTTTPTSTTTATSTTTTPTSTTTTPTTTTTTPTTTTTTPTTTTTTPTTTTTTPTTTTTTTSTTTTTTTSTTTASTTKKPVPPCCACACGLELSIVVTVSFSAIFAVESNCFDIIRGLAFVAPLIAALAAAAISFSFNKCVISRGDGVACRFNDIDACNGTIVTCHENTFESHDCPCILECARPITLQGSAKFELCLNTFISFGGSPQIKFGGAVSLIQQAQLLINSNSLSRGDAEACDVPFFMFENFIQLAAGAEMSLSQNDCFDNSGSGNKALLCALAIGKLFTPCSTCAVNFCLNNYYDELLQTEAELGVAISSILIPLLSPILSCSEAGYTTGAPSSNGVAGRGVAVVLVAFAALFALMF